MLGRDPSAQNEQKNEPDHTSDNNSPEDGPWA